MPMYEFLSTVDGSVAYKRYPISKAPPLGSKRRIGGVVYIRILESNSVKTPPPGNWPMKTTFGAVRPQQCGELAALLKREKVTGVDVLPDGNVRIADNSARNAYMKARGLRDNNAGYSQWAGTH